MRLWKAGLVAAVMAGAVGFGCGGVTSQEDSSPGAAVNAVQDVETWDNQCGVTRCIDLEREKNITHIFLDFGDCPVEDFDVTLTTESRGTEDVTDRLKTKGGPCKELNADYRFEVQGPDKEARVCITFHDYITDVRVGAKDADECRYEPTTLHEQTCQRCDQQQ